MYAVVSGKTNAGCYVGCYFNGSFIKEEFQIGDRLMVMDVCTHIGILDDVIISKNGCYLILKMPEHGYMGILLDRSVSVCKAV